MPQSDLRSCVHAPPRCGHHQQMNAVVLLIFLFLFLFLFLTDEMFFFIYLFFFFIKGLQVSSRPVGAIGARMHQSLVTSSPPPPRSRYTSAEYMGRSDQEWVFTGLQSAGGRAAGSFAGSGCPLPFQPPDTSPP